MGKFALLFIFIFAGGLFSALFIAPIASFVVYQVVYFVNPDIRWWAASIPGLPYSFIASVMMILMLVIKYRELSNFSSWSREPALKWIIALAIMYTIMINVAIVPGMHKRFTIDFLKLVVIIFVAYKLINSERALNACLWTYVLGATYIGYIAYTVGRDANGRVEGIGMVDTGSDGNMTAAAIVPALIILIYFAWMGNKNIKILAIFCGAFVANGVVLINSRGAFLGTVVGASFLLFYMLFSKYQRKGQRSTAVLIVVLSLSGALYVTDDLFWTRMQTLQNVDDGETSGSHRTDFWMATFTMLEDYPLGVGIHGFIELSSNYLPWHYFESGISGKAVHSTWFQSLAELGWPGPFIFFGLLYSTFRGSRKAKKYILENKLYEIYFKFLALEGALISYLVAASFINRARAEVLFWLVLFLISAINVYYFNGNNLSSKGNKKVSAQ